MKKILLFLFVLSVVFPAHSAIIVGKVDIQKVLITVKEGAQVSGKLKKIFDKKQTEMKKEEGKIRAIQEKYKKQSLVMNDSAKMKKEREIQEMILKFQRKLMENQKMIQGMEVQMKNPILDKISAIISEVSKKANVDVTVQSGTNPVIYAKNEKDLTDDVIKLYDKKHSAKKK